MIICDEIYAPGETSRHQNSSAGRYVAVEGFWQRGREVVVNICVMLRKYDSRVRFGCQVTEKFGNKMIFSYASSSTPYSCRIECLLLPPKLQRRGLVFKGKMVTVEHV